MVFGVVRVVIGVVVVVVSSVGQGLEFVIPDPNTEQEQ